MARHGAQDNTRGGPLVGLHSGKGSFKLGGLALLLSQFGFDLVAVDVVVGQGGVDLGQGEAFVILRDFFGGSPV